MAVDPARVRHYQQLVAPGTPLREGLERIVSGRTGALVVLGSNKVVQQISTGGFGIDVEFTPTALRELAKMDGALVLSPELDRILLAGVHLMPDAGVPTAETGTRHRTADRVARQAGVPVVTVSQSMATIALYVDGSRIPVLRSEPLLARADQALATLDRYKSRLQEAVERLDALEVQDQVVVRDVAVVVQRFEMVRRMQAEVEGYIIELGTDGRLARLQLDEAAIGLDDLAELLAKDYAGTQAEFDLAALLTISTADLADPLSVVRTMGAATQASAEDRVSPRGHRLLAALHRLPTTVATRLIEHFGNLQALFGASTSDLLAVDGVGENRARMVREGLVRMADAAYQDR
ncbi:MAG: DNA integrity scanning diadenylate cyclase DisA [Propionibacteriaceae bacterium]